MPGWGLSQENFLDEASEHEGMALVQRTHPTCCQGPTMLEPRVNPDRPKGDTDLESPQTGHKGRSHLLARSSTGRLTGLEAPGPGPPQGKGAQRGEWAAQGHTAQ